jgi:hypothetical protein
MDEAWTWGILATFAVLVTGAMLGFAPGIIDRSAKWGWWLVVVSPLPLLVWNILWVSMTNPPDGTRRSISLVVGAIAGGVILLGVTELLRAQPQQSPSGNGASMSEPSGPASQPPSISAPNNSGIIAPNNSGTITQNQGPPRIPLGLYQNGFQIGLVEGFELSPDGKQIIFANPKIASGTVDFLAGMEFQDWMVDCRSLAPQRGGQAAFTVSTAIGRVPCSIIAKR